MELLVCLVLRDPRELQVSEDLPVSWARRVRSALLVQKEIPARWAILADLAS